ncbi:MAG: transcription termination/antitermination protein NusA [Candidatus Doudnabacteria bacterium CG10_big_fil_rev_8_21_14_0_10_41_10]|uniref:Transcription termination/antitermination protein NusA n=1 Tax=Candidatus Doudnabacteria bacterium CG10_big_fil_rev_8_21_14_0_10_41_10 TaxID=1974551 RepID=A0A2H0VCM5_9BACT|nr:MAG: transcription termination/antitermination protein NusA [Candidatus Doudnabacteria bacterium CG10_big_fil_rev_8_21_14_0_10_41_10]
MNEQFEEALKQLEEEKGIDRKELLIMIEGALAAAFRKDYGKKNQNVMVELKPETMGTKVFDVKTVVDDPKEEDQLEDPQKTISLSQAKKKKKSAKVGDTIKTDITPKTGTNFGRIAAQTAKQVIVQKLREAERDIVFKEYKAKERNLITGVVQRMEGDTVLVDLGRGGGVLFPSEQIRGENYRIGSRIKVLVLHVEPTPKGPKITLSRSHPDMVRRLFEIEVPEVSAGIVEIKAVAREAGSRVKVAVWSNQDGIDPIGSCVGQRGTRVQTIMNELGGEKIDIVAWAEDIVKFIANSLSPAKIINVELNEEAKEAKVSVMEDQLSLAIGKAGQNVRLAARLTGWKLDIKGEKIGRDEEEKPTEEKPAEVAVEPVEEAVVEEEKNEEKKEEKNKEEGSKE